jgi:hypothetical protein
MKERDPKNIGQSLNGLVCPPSMISQIFDEGVFDKPARTIERKTNEREIDEQLSASKERLRGTDEFGAAVG